MPDTVGISMSTIASETGTLNWSIDPAHSSVDFSVKHMGIFTVRGALGAITGTGVTEGGKLSSITLSIDAAGISTNNEQRDGHLKSGDCLNVTEYPTIEFKSTSIKANGDAEYSVTGDLTLVGNVHPVTVNVEVVAPVKDPWGNSRSGATGSGVLHRKDWGLTYNAVMETGHLMISDEIKFTFDIQAVVAS
jgi:polyisoprenoid-binding protein YceI